MADAADHDNLDAARQELHDLLQKPSLAGIPLLVLGNKSDLPGALSTNDLIDRLELKVCQQSQIVSCVSPLWTSCTCIGTEIAAHPSTGVSLLLRGCLPLQICCLASNNAVDQDRAALLSTHSIAIQRAHGRH